jgi:hypothetical protein
MTVLAVLAATALVLGLFLVRRRRTATAAVSAAEPARLDLRVGAAEPEAEQVGPGHRAPLA